MGRPDLQENFTKLVNEHKGIVYKIANAYCSNDEDRKDLVQEIIIQIWRALPSYDGEHRLSTWLYRIILNVSISFYRRNKTRKNKTLLLLQDVLNYVDEGDDPEIDEEIRQLYSYINELRELDRALMILYLDSRSYSEIAEILGISETNVSTKIGRIKVQLRQKLNY